MNEEERAVREGHLRARVQAGDVDGAAAGAIKLYGAELFGFLLALHRQDEDAAGEVFAWSVVDVSVPAVAEMQALLNGR